MKGKIKKQVNKNLKMIFIIALLIVIGMGVLLMLISGNDEDRNEVPINPAETEQQDDKKDRKDRKLAEIDDHPGVSDTALNMYNARVDDISDTAQVAQLLEASEMREDMGGYLVTIKTKDGSDILLITYEKQLMSGEDTAFDEMATWYAEQFLALIEEADEVKWAYKIEKDHAEIEAEKAELEKAAKEAAEKEKAKKNKDSDSNKDSDKKDSEKNKDADKKNNKTEPAEIKVEKYKTVERSLTVKQADELLGTEVKGYSETPELVQTLINNQKGIV